MDEDSDAKQVEHLFTTPGLANALESDRFKQFLDHVPVAIAVSELYPAEAITYANLEFERLTGKAATDIQGKSWTSLPGVASASDDSTRLGDAVQAGEEYIGTFDIEIDGVRCEVDAWSNTIEDEEGIPIFRLVALAGSGQHHREANEQRDQLIRDKETALLELQHRVKNNLQMITALIRMEARNVPDGETGARFDRLAGRVQSLALLYSLLSDEAAADSIDLGIYLSQVASSVMQAHAQEGIRLELKVDTWPVSLNVALPTGLVVNELMTNALKHAFVGRNGGTISLDSLVDDTGCYVTIADDGVGLPPNVSWPKSGKLGALIAQSLRQNAGAKLDVYSVPNEGTRIRIFFSRQAAAPDVA
jgi:two-component sensor histidine kinase